MERVDDHARRSRMEHTRNYTSLALKHVWSFLKNHLQFANTHGAEFISGSHWETFVPERCRDQLLSMTREELVNLSQYQDLTTSTGGRRQVNCSENSSLDTSDQSDIEAGDWLLSFISMASTCHLDNMATLSTLSDVKTCLKAGSSCVQESTDALSETAMSEKKNHEIRAMTEAVMTVFSCCSADVVVDVGSGKGYLGWELANQHKLPVLGLDSCHTNTHGAVKREGKLARQWKSQAGRKKSKNRSCEGVADYDPNCSKTSHPFQNEHGCARNNNCIPSLSSVGADNLVQPQMGTSAGLCQHCSFDRAERGHTSESPHGDLVAACRVCVPCFREVSFIDSGHKVTHQDKAQCGGSSLGTNNPTETSLLEIWNTSRREISLDEHKCHQTSSMSVGTGISSSLPASTVPADTKHTGDEQLGSAAGPSGLSLCSYVPVTLTVDTGMDIQKTLQDYASRLGLDSPLSSNILLTGLHTCGSLSVTLMELFLQSPKAVGLCFVGCCYQLMEEADVGNGEMSMPASLNHFPLSEIGQQLNMHLGRNARNLASQSVARTQASGQLQGADFCWRAMLNVLLWELGVAVPERILGMRGLNRRSKLFLEYVQAALVKLKISSDLIPPGLVASIEDRYKDIGHKMSAFFQLKLVLAPVIESLILLDRCLYLLEHESVRDIHLVRLFDPVTSPRCYGIIAVKEKLVTQS